MRFSKFLAIVGERLDEQCEELLHGLLQHGRLTLESIINRAISNNNEGNTDVQDAHRANFVRLVNAHFVERCPVAQPGLEPIQASASSRKRGVKSFEETPTLEKRAVATAAPSESERFSVTVDAGKDIDARSSHQTPSVTSGGKKRKQEALEIDNESIAAICEKEILWRANFEEFVRCLRHKACVANVRSKMDIKAGTVLGAMLLATRGFEENVKVEKSVSLSMDTILQEVRGRSEGLEMTLEHVRSTLNQLGSHSCVSGTDGLYSIDMKNIIEVSKHDEVELVVQKRYGQDAYRIFRLLAKKGGFLETDRISDISLIEKKDAVKILFQLLKDNFLVMERMQSPQLPNRHFLLWKVIKGSLWEHVLDEMYHAALNLSQRIIYEMEQEQELLQMPRDLMTEEQKKRFGRIRNIMLLMESSLLKLDDALMLFHDF